jgi:type IV pilus assembly protein PilW
MEKRKTLNDWGLPAGPMAGFTLIELLIAMALGLIVLAGLFRTFKVQQDSYLLQDQVSTMQQNLRGAMYVITRDLQMAGYYTNFDGNNITMDWNGDGTVDASEQNRRPLILARDNKNDPDEIVIVKASREEGRPLTGGESAAGTSINVGQDLDGQSGDDLDTTGKMYGVLVKNDLSRAELFHLRGGGTLERPLNESYSGNASDPSLSDRVHRADIVIYRVDKSNPARPCLVRRNLGNDNKFQTVAENIENLQFRYLLKDGVTWVADPGPSQNNVRAVEVLLIGRTAFPQRGYVDTSTYTFGTGPTAESYTPQGDERKYRRRVLTTLVKTRNIGL